MRVLGILFMISTAVYGQWVWLERAPMPLPRAGYIAGALAGKLVIAGGSYWNGDKKVWSDRTDYFDPTGNTWTSGPALPDPKSDAACVVVGDALYTFGGGAEGGITSEVWQLRNGTWSRRPEMLPEPRLYAVAVADGETIYVIGGLAKPGDYGSAANTLWSWRPGRPFTKMPPIPGAGRVSHAAAIHGGKLYVFGGVTMDGALQNLDDSYVFDPSSGTWNTLPALPVARRAWWAVPLQNSIALLGGYTDQFSDEIFEFDPAKLQTRRAGRLPFGLADAKFYTVGRSIVTTGGEVGVKVRGSSTIQSTFSEANAHSK